MECLNMRFVRIGSKNTVLTARTQHEAITAACGLFTFTVLKWADQIGSNGSINNYKFTDELCLDRRTTIVQYSTGSFQQNFGVFTNFNSVFYDLLVLPSYFMPGFHELFASLHEQIRGVKYCEKIQRSTTVDLQPDLILVWHWALACIAGPRPPS